VTRDEGSFAPHSLPLPHHAILKLYRLFSSLSQLYFDTAYLSLVIIYHNHTSTTYPLSITMDVEPPYKKSKSAPVSSTEEVLKKLSALNLNLSSVPSSLATEEISPLTPGEGLMGNPQEIADIRKAHAEAAKKVNNKATKDEGIESPDPSEQVDEWEEPPESEGAGSDEEDIGLLEGNDKFGSDILTFWDGEKWVLIHPRDYLDDPEFIESIVYLASLFKDEFTDASLEGTLSYSAHSVSELYGLSSPLSSIEGGRAAGLLVPSALSFSHSCRSYGFGENLVCYYGNEDRKG
jgi:hypothetical protein